MHMLERPPDGNEDYERLEARGEMRKFANGVECGIRKCGARKSPFGQDKSEIARIKGVVREALQYNKTMWSSKRNDNIENE